MRNTASMISSLTIAASVLLASATPVSPVMSSAVAQESLADMRAQQQEQQKLQREAAYTGSVCDIRLSARINWSASRNWPQGRSLADACDSALSGLEAVCRGNLKEKVQQKISSFECAGDGSGPSLRGSTLRFGAGNGSGFGQTKSYLEGALR